MIFDALIDPSRALEAHARLRHGARFVHGRDMRDGVGAGDCESIEDKITRLQALVPKDAIVTRSELRRVMRSPCDDSFADALSTMIVRGVLSPEKNKFRRAI